MTTELAVLRWLILGTIAWIALGGIVAVIVGTMIHITNEAGDES